MKPQEILTKIGLKLNRYNSYKINRVVLEEWLDKDCVVLHHTSEVFGSWFIIKTARTYMGFVALSDNISFLHKTTIRKSIPNVLDAIKGKYKIPDKALFDKFTDYRLLEAF